MDFNAMTKSSFHAAGTNPTKPFDRASVAMIHKSKNIEQAFKTVSVGLRPNN